MGGVKRKTGASILEHETHAFDSDSRTEIAEDALNPAHDISFTVGYRQIGGVASGYLSGAHLSVGLARIDQRGALARMFLRE